MASKSRKTGAPSTGLRAAVRAIGLENVRLAEGPLLERQRVHLAYMKSIDPERLLHNFRVTAGLESKAEPLGGWEQPIIGVRGHYAGHYLSACGWMWQSMGDEELKDRAAYLVAEMAACQRKHGNGYVGAFGTDYLELQETMQFAWAPYYVVHKLLAGLIDLHVKCATPGALEVACGLADHVVKRLSPFTPGQIDAMMVTTQGHPIKEFGGISESLHDLHALTGEESYRRLAESVFDRRWFLEPLARGRNILAGLHVNTHVPMIAAAARRYEISGDETCRLAVENFWRMVTSGHCYVDGGSSGPRPGGGTLAEHWDFHGRLLPGLNGKTNESCVTHNLLKVTAALYRWTGDVRYAHYRERAYWNSVLTRQNPNTGMFLYYMNLAHHSVKEWGEPMNSFTCCYGTNTEAFSRLADETYFEDADGLIVNEYLASRAAFMDRGVGVEQETKYPTEDTTTLRFFVAGEDAGRAPHRVAAKRGEERAVEMTVKLRIPAWAAGAKVTLNGRATKAAKAGEYWAMRRAWADGDELAVRLPMRLRTEGLPDAPEVAALLYGPTVLAACCDKDLMYTGPLATLPKRVRPAGTPEEPVAFAMDTPHGPVTLKPLASVLEGQYGVYLRPPFASEACGLLGAWKKKGGGAVGGSWEASGGPRASRVARASRP